MVDTFQKNRVGIPPELKVVKDKAELSNEIYWEVNGKYNISSYVVKTSTGKKSCPDAFNNGTSPWSH